MLILLRKIGEAIVIGDNITVMVVDIKQGRNKHAKPRVVLGIEAPKEIAVDRSEIWKAKRRSA
jgi:carbon storage regulator